MDSTKNIFKIWMAPLILASSIAYGRFEPEDANRIDPEEKNNTESWNDKNSYRYPMRWDETWWDSSFGYRVNAGSLNASRFNYDDDVMIEPRRLDTFNAAFIQSRRQDLAEETTEREIRTGWGFTPGMRLSILGEVNTLKEFGDIGMALGLRENARELTEIYGWSVDHYYDSKRSDEASERNDHSHTYGIRSRRKRASNSLGWDLKFENDTPVDWLLPSQGWDYSYERRLLSSRIDIPLYTDCFVYAALNAERKFERKIALDGGGLDGHVFKSMDRRAIVSEFGTEFKTEASVQYQVALQSIKRDVAYKYGSSNRNYTGWLETFGPSEVRRNEWGFILTRHTPVTTNFAFQQGTMINDAYIREDAAVWRKLEIKYQALFDFTLNDNTFFVLNTTWDIDQIAVDYPYSKAKPFRPWGGGNLQFMMRM